MRAAICNQYLDTLGGGERYTSSFAKVLLDLGWSVDMEWKDGAIKKALETRFGIDLKRMNVLPDVKRGDGYDLCFWISDGSIPLLRARKNLLHFQIPFHDVGGKSLLNRMKFFRINGIICNSRFTKEVIDKEYGVESVVVYPPVDVFSIKPKRKEDMILFVGRFSNLKQSKHQDILIKAFKKMVDGGLRNWRLILAGGVEVGDGGFTRGLEEMAQGYPIEIVKSPEFKMLKDLYGRAKIFWSASGYGVDEEKNPENTEHFGISVVEAMAAGSVPLVFDAGGHREIISDSQDGFLWRRLPDLIGKTLIAIKNRPVLAKMAIESSKSYSYENFKSNIEKLL
jgi:glycosyltransferase involved in cell wall biosynthesis